MYVLKIKKNIYVCVYITKNTITLKNLSRAALFIFVFAHNVEEPAAIVRKSRKNLRGMEFERQILEVGGVNFFSFFFRPILYTHAAFCRKIGIPKWPKT